MSLFSNPIVICGFIALSIIFILIIVVIICCKRSEAKEREELMTLSEEIDASIDAVEMEQPDKIEDVLSKMQEVLNAKEETVSTFEEEQEENAVISYQELLDSLGTNKIDINTIGIYEDELENQIEISDFNKEIIDDYQKEDLQREFYNFQNDYSSGAMPIETEALVETPVMNLEVSEENIDYIEEPKKEVLDLSNNVATSSPKKFKKTKIISPVYGIVNNEVETPVNFVNDDVVEEIIFDDDSLLDEF